MTGTLPVETYENIIRRSGLPALLNVFARTCRRLASLAESIGRELADEWALHEMVNYPGVGLDGAFTVSKVAHCRHGLARVDRRGFGSGGQDSSLYVEYDRGRALTWTLSFEGGGNGIEILHGRPHSHIYLARCDSVDGFVHEVRAIYDGGVASAYIPRRGSKIVVVCYGDVHKCVVSTRPEGYLVDDIYRPDLLEQWFEREIGHTISLPPRRYDFSNDTWGDEIRAHLPELI